MQLPRLRPAKGLAFGLFLAVSSLPAHPPAQDVPLRSSVELVVVPVLVADKDGQPLVSLEEKDFRIFEDKAPQAIATFSMDLIPMSVAVLIDGSLSETSMSKVRQSFAALVGSIAEGDEVALYRFDRYVEKLLDFTGDITAVDKTLQERFENSTPAAASTVGGPFSNPGPVINGIPVVPGVQAASAPRTPPKVLNDAIFLATNDLGAREVERRRIIIVISDGENRGSEHSTDDTVDRLLDRSVQVFGIGMDTAFLSRRFTALGSFADASGGQACFVNSQEGLESCYFRTTEKARSQYVLGYVSSNKRPRGRPVFREIKVEVQIKGAEVRHRKGYFQAP